MCGVGQKSRWVLLGLLVVAAIVLRGVRAWQEPVINPDAIRFVDMAQGLGADFLGALRSESYHPLHAVLGRGVYAVIAGTFETPRLDWLRSMQIVGVACGGLICLVVYRLARLMGAPFWASAGAAALWAVGRRPVGFGPDGLSDMLFLLLFGTSMLAGMDGLGRLCRPHATGALLGRFGAAGVLAGLAYLTRPEGLAAPLILGATLLMMVLPRPHRSGYGLRNSLKVFPRRHVNPWHGAMAMAALAVGAFAVALPYMLVIGGITQKKQIVENVSPEVTVASLGVWDGTVWYRMAMELWETFGFAPMLVIGAAMLLRPGWWGRPRLRLLTLVWVVLWLSVMGWLLRTAGYLDGRHTLPVQIVLYGVFALALVAWRRPRAWWVRWMKGRGRWESLNKAWRWRGWMGVQIAGIWALAMVPGVLMLKESRTEERFHVRDAAAWVASQVPAGTVVLEHDLLVGYYSGHAYARWHGTPGNWMLGEIETKRSGRDAVLVYVYRPMRGDVIQPEIGRFRLAATFRSALPAGDVVALYR